MELVDLVGIEPATSPASRGAFSAEVSKHRSTPESSDAISSSLTVFRAVAPLARYQIVPHKPKPKVPELGLRTSVHAGVL